MRVWETSFCVLGLMYSLIAGAGPRFDVSPSDALRDSVWTIRLSGLASGEIVTLRAQTEDATGKKWASWARLQADTNGKLDLAEVAPLDGTYHRADAMGLLWSLTPTESADPAGRFFVSPPTERIRLSLEKGNQVVATADVSRRTFDADRTERVPVAGQPFVGTYFRPRDGKPHPALLVLGGSEGGLEEDSAALLSTQGYATLALAYFSPTIPTLKPELVEIPLEYFEEALDWLRSQPEVDANRILVDGVSKGGELALLLASHYPDLLHGAVAYVPSSVVWQGLSMQNPPPVVSSWTVKGKDLPFVPLQVLPSDFASMPYSLRPIFERSLANAGAVASATIPVEQIHGPVLLFSGQDDQIWPSSQFTQSVAERLHDRGFAYPLERFDYPGAGHMFSIPFQPAAMLHFGPMKLGGTMEANAQAAREAWMQTVAFLKQATGSR